jgi:hypothetical protein
MKLISVTILLICLTAATFNQWLQIICFDLNEGYIEKELCVNKNNPSSHCNGHCYLSKQLDKDEKSSNPLNSSLKEKFEIQLFCADALNIINVVSYLIAAPHSHLQSFVPQEVMRAHFRPPNAA